jgi:hypothetical protein
LVESDVALQINFNGGLANAEVVTLPLEFYEKK